VTHLVVKSFVSLHWPHSTIDVPNPFGCKIKALVTFPYEKEKEKEHNNQFSNMRRNYLFICYALKTSLSCQNPHMKTEEGITENRSYKDFVLNL
jgi:hypothetical protein